MKITKFGHCCLLIEDKGLRILTDPGAYTTAQNDIKGIDVVLITHEHIDHFHIDSVKKILENNPDTKIVTNSAINAFLEKEGIVGVQIVEDTQSFEYKEVKFEGFGEKHKLIHKEWAIVQNTGFFINEKLFYPGDAFTNPEKPVEILALPLAGTWLNVSEAIDYCIDINPKVTFPVHDGGLNDQGLTFTRVVAPKVLEKHQIDFLDFEIGKEYEF